MQANDKVNILLVDDQPGKLLSYEVILRELEVNLIKAASATEALQQLLKNEIAVILVDVCMPELDGFQLAAMIRDHPRFQHTAIIFISAIQFTEMDHMRGYEMGAVDYISVPVVPEVLRAKVKVFAELFRKTRQLEQLNRELEQRVAERTADLEASTAGLLESERRRSLALAAGQMGSWDWNIVTGQCLWDAGQYRIFGVEPDDFELSLEKVRPHIHAEDFARIETILAELGDKPTFQTEVRILRPNGDVRWCICAAAVTKNAYGQVVRASGVTIDITDRKDAEERQSLLAREVDHRARNTLAVVQAIVRLTRAHTTQSYVSAVEGRIRALAQTHTLLSQSRWQGADVARLVYEELAPYRSSGSTQVTVEGPSVFLAPDKAQTIALALHELATNAAKYGALSVATGEVRVSWELDPSNMTLHWTEVGGPRTEAPTTQGFGTKIMNTSIKHQIGGRVGFDWRPEGLHCTIVLPRGAPDHVERAEATDSNLVQFMPGHSKRLLLVEDEALVGMMMRDLLTEIGFLVVGPFCSLAEAVSAAASQDFHGAILDVNLAGELVYPLADALATRGVPFVFVTGYDEEGVDVRFAKVPVLQKPIGRELLEHTLRIRFDAGPDGERIDERRAAGPHEDARTA